MINEYITYARNFTYAALRIIDIQELRDIYNILEDCYDGLLKGVICVGTLGIASECINIVLYSKVIHESAVQYLQVAQSYILRALGER